MKKTLLNKVVKLHDKIVQQEKKYRKTCDELTDILIDKLNFDCDCLHTAVMPGDGLCLCFEYGDFNHVVPIPFLIEYLLEHETIDYEEIRKLSI